MSYEAKINKLTLRAKQLVSYSEAYAQSVMYAERDNETSIHDIKLANTLARNKATPTPFKEIMRCLAGSNGFAKAEQEMKEAMSKMVDAQMEMERIFKLTPKQSNEVLNAMISTVKEKLFTEILLREIYS